MQARTDAWARKIQVQQSEEQALREEARLKNGLSDLKDVAQAKVTYTQFKAQLIAADALVLSREDTLRNILGLPPNDNRAHHSGFRSDHASCSTLPTGRSWST